MAIKFKSAEKYYGIRVYISEHSDKNFYLTKSLIESLKNVEIKFRQNRINVPLPDLFKSLVIIKGNTERAEVNKSFKAALYNWKAFFETDMQAIVFDLNMFKDKEQSIEEQLTNTLVHEIGHAIHLKFVTPDASKYITVVGKQYVNVINRLKDFKSIVGQNVHDDDLCISLVKKAEDVFYDFADLLDNSINSLDYDEKHKTSNISFQICEEYELYLKEKGIKTYTSKIEKMISVIMKFIPSEYGATEEKEFFAECFRQFILSPDDLSLNNRNMIINALTYSRAQGKELMQAHKLLKSYVKYIID